MRVMIVLTGDNGRSMMFWFSQEERKWKRDDGSYILTDAHLGTNLEPAASSSPDADFLR
jgi:hypothetical protein